MRFGGISAEISVFETCQDIVLGKGGSGVFVKVIKYGVKEVATSILNNTKLFSDESSLSAYHTENIIH